jgi:hypothetical protein
MQIPQLQHQTIKIRQLIDSYRAGKIVIPEFQREYVWKKSKAPELIDSVYRGFPISSLLVWESSEEIRSRRRDPKPSRSSSMNWLIDGQQRVITLARTMAGDEGIEVVFNADTDAFRLANAATNKDPNWIRVSDILDDQQFRFIRKSLDASYRVHQTREGRYDALRKILDYEVPVVRMVDHSFADAVHAFKRINTLGVRLKKEDIESAQVAARHSGFIADEVAPYLESLRRGGFNRLTVMHLFRACAFVARPDGRNRTPLHELDKVEVMNAWKATRKATDQALALIRSQLGLVNMNVLWSGSLIVPVIAICASSTPRQRNANEIAAWLASAALLHRYSGSSETALDQDLRACRQEDPIGALLKNLKTIRPSIWAHGSDFSGALNDKGGLLAAYVACKHQGAVDFFTGENIVLQAGIDRHHILPRGQFEEGIKSEADNIANIAFIAGDVNKAIGLSGPEVYLKKIKKSTLQSQCVPTDPELWSIDCADEFWEARRELLAESFNDYLRISLANRRLGR